jgi:hypothetical protein
VKRKKFVKATCSATAGALLAVNMQRFPIPGGSQLVKDTQQFSISKEWIIGVAFSCTVFVQSLMKIHQLDTDDTRVYPKVSGLSRELNIRLPLTLLVEKQHKGLWRQNSLD